MYKLRNAIIDKMISNRISSYEIDFLLYIAQFQEDNGTVRSVYYKEICDVLSISTQKYYDILKSLSEKQFLSYEKINPLDIKVKILNNDFSGKNFSGGYLKVVKYNFMNEKFKKLRAGSKLLFLYMDRLQSGHHAKVATFYNAFCEKFGVAKKTLQSYIHELKKAFLLFVGLKRNKSYNYEINLKPSTVINNKESYIPNESEGRKKNLKDCLWRTYSKFLPKDSTAAEKALDDVVNMTDTQRARRSLSFVDRVFDAIKKSFTIQHSEGKNRPTFNAAHINKLLSSGTIA